MVREPVASARGAFLSISVGNPPDSESVCLLFPFLVLLFLKQSPRRKSTMVKRCLFSLRERIKKKKKKQDSLFSRSLRKFFTVSHLLSLSRLLLLLLLLSLCSRRETGFAAASPSRRKAAVSLSLFKLATATDFRLSKLFSSRRV